MPASRIRVLIVDDSRDYAMSLSSALSRYAVLEVVGWAADGADALRQVATAGPHLVLMDIAMPGMNGLDATRVLKRLPSPPYVVVLTMYDLDEYRRAAAEAGADGFVVKSEVDTDVLMTLEAECPRLFAESSAAAW